MRTSNTEVILDLKVVFDLDHFFLNVFCELPTTQYYVVDVGYIHISDMLQESKSETSDGLKFKFSRHRIQCVVLNKFPTTKQSLGCTLYRFPSHKGRPQASAAASRLVCANNFLRL